MDIDVQRIIDATAAETTVSASIVTLLTNNFKLLQDALAGSGPISAADRAELQATVQNMLDTTSEQAAAVVANTPAATPPPPPAPDPNA